MEKKCNCGENEACSNCQLSQKGMVFIGEKYDHKTLQNSIIQKFAEYIRKFYGRTYACYDEKKQYQYTCMAVSFKDITEAVENWKSDITECNFCKGDRRIELIEDRQTRCPNCKRILDEIRNY